MSNHLFIAWVPFQRRSISMQSYFEYELVFITFSSKYRWIRPFEYLFKALKTLVLLFAHRPDVCWIQLPPNFILHITILFKWLFNNQTRMIADCHNATFRSPWIKIPGTVNFLNRCDVVIVHNSSIGEEANALGVLQEKILILEDPPARIKQPENLTIGEISHPLIVCPCSFNRDEPIQEIIQAAQLSPNISFALTGNPDRARGIHCLTDLPDNVKLTGFLSETDFNCLLHQADLILGLTKLDGIQLSVANEAIGIGKPLVLANTQTLQKLFYQGAIFVNPLEPESIAQGCRDAIKQLDTLSRDIHILKTERDNIWLRQANSILESLA